MTQTKFKKSMEAHKNRNSSLSKWKVHGGQFTLHTKHNLKKKTPPPSNKREAPPLHSMTPVFSLVAWKFYS
jgi:hypothetical protein